MTADNDINAIFEKNSIQLVSEILSKTRTTIERKKEDLRIMVGERYRDLIEAADTIATMQRSAEAICDNIENMESLCESLKQRGLIGFKTKTTALPVSDYYKTSNGGHQYSIAMQVKLLVDVPEILWGLTEKKEFLNAAQLFLLSQHAHTALQLSSKASLVLDAFPVISRQWSNISQFKGTIMKGCIKKIKHEVNDIKSVLDAVAAMMLLENYSMHQIFLKILDLRKTALFSALEIKPSVIARTQFIEFIVLFISSLEIIHYLFEKNDSTICQIEKELKLISNQSNTANQENIAPIYLLNESSTGLSFLPKSVVEFRPAVRNNFQTLEQDQIKRDVDDWIKLIIVQSSPFIKTLLSYTMNIKSLSLIRNSVYEAQNSKIEKESWRMIVSSLMNNSSFTPWKNIINDQVLERCKILLSKELENTKQTIVTMIRNLAIDILKNSRTCLEEGDITSFVWSETASDLPDQVGSMTASSRQSANEKSGLFYKTRGYTKRVQAICKALNNKLSYLLEDLLHFAPASLKENELSSEEGSAINDYNILLQFLESETNSIFIACMDDLKEISEDYFSRSVELPVDEYNDSSPGCTIFVIVSRLSHAFSVVCPKLKICAEASLMGNEDTIRRVNLGVQPYTESWISLKKELLSSSSCFMIRFLTIVTESISLHMKKDFLEPVNSGKAEDLLAIFSTWECIPIEEEGESGNVVRSSIYVPAYPSPALSEALMKVCSCVNCVSAHTITRTCQMELEQQLSHRLLLSYENLVECLDIINQTTAIQLIFDLKLIQTIFMPRDAKALIERLSKLVRSFETRVDPFDLDVFNPHISIRVKMSASRLQVLLGILLPKDRQPLISKGHSQTSSSSRANNALPIIPSVDIPRFSNVPLPIASSKLKLSDPNSILGTTDLERSTATFKGSDISNEKSLSKDSLKAFSDTSISSSRSAAASIISSWFGGNT